METLAEKGERYFREVWDEANTDAIYDWMLSDVEAEGVAPNRVVGPDAFAEFHRAMCALVTDIKVTINQTVEAPPWLSVYATFTGACAKTGAPVAISFQSMLRFEGERLAFGYNNVDFQLLFEQLGQIPEGSLERLFAGERLTLA